MNGKNKLNLKVQKYPTIRVGSGRWELNPLPSPWQGDVLTDELRPQ